VLQKWNAVIRLKKSSVNEKGDSNGPITPFTRYVILEDSTKSTAHSADGGHN